MLPKKETFPKDTEEELLRETGESNTYDSYDGYKQENKVDNCSIKSMRILALVSLISGVLWVILAWLHMRKSWIMLIVFGMSSSVLLILMIMHSMRPVDTSQSDEDESDFVAIIGNDPKMRELVYRFNKARMQERKSKAKLSMDGNCLTVEVEVNFEQMNKDVQGFHRVNTDQLTEQGDGKPVFFTNKFYD